MRGKIPRQKQKDSVALPVSPPHDLDAEVSVLGSILLEPTSIDRVRRFLHPKDFYLASHGHVYRTALAMTAAAEPIDNVTLAAELERLGLLESVGGRAQLGRMQGAVPTAANIEHYGRIVREKAVQRRDAKRQQARELLEQVRAEESVDVGELEEIAALLDQVRAFVAKYLIVPGAHYLDVIALWIAHAHAIGAFDTTPRLFGKSAEKESGKTRLHEILNLLTPSPRLVFNTTPAAIYRRLKESRITLLVDEADLMFSPKAAKQNEDLKALLNAGYTRSATVDRVVGEGKKMQVEEFPVFAATALAANGNLPETIESRSIVVPLRRRAPDEALQPFRLREARTESEPLRQALAAWAEVAEAQLAIARPAMPDGVTDRAADVWEPLMSIADLAGTDWPQRARTAAVAIVSSRVDDDLSWGVRLLADIREAFAVEEEDRISSLSLVRALNGLTESAWGGLHDRQGLDQRDLARRLKPYGILSRSVRLADGTVLRGYLREQFADAWKRYLRVDERPPAPAVVDLTAALDDFWLEPKAANGQVRARVVGVNSHFEIVGEDGTQLVAQPFVGPLQATSYAKRQGWEVTEA